ncbi:unnamed protein product [Amoebophrya sp. A120]|nr:unnamed protein product [Amoebophrya sp. A120]|eukprot:GSA120T00003002001.1
MVTSAATSSSRNIDASPGSGRQPDATSNAAAPARTTRMLIDVLEVVTQATAYVFQVIIFKLIVSRPEDAKEGTEWLKGLRFHFDAPLFLSVFIASTSFCVVSLFLCVSPTKPYEKQLVTTQWRYFGVPIGLMGLFVFFNVINAFAELYALMYLPASIMESILMTAPALSVIFTRVLQPSIRYNNWAYFSIIPIVAGGILSALPANFREDVQSTGGRENFGLGLFWAITATIFRVVRVIVVDMVSGQFEERMIEEEQNELAPRIEHLPNPQEETEDERAAVLNAQRGGAQNEQQLPVPAFGRLADLEVDQEQEENRPLVVPAREGEREAGAQPMPNVVNILRIMGPVSAVAYLVMSLSVERNWNGDRSWTPAVRVGEIFATGGALRLFELSMAVIFGEGLLATMWVLSEFRLTERCGAFAAAIFGNVNRSVTAVGAVLMLRESFAWWQGVGIGVMAVGVLIRFLLGNATSVRAGERLDQMPRHLREEIDEDQVTKRVSAKVALRDVESHMAGFPLGEISTIDRQVTEELQRQVVEVQSRQASRQVSREHSANAVIGAQEKTLFPAGLPKGRRETGRTTEASSSSRRAGSRFRRDSSSSDGFSSDGR